MVGHTSIVYAVDSHIFGLVASGGEDCLAKIWKDGICAQSIDHPGCVWDVKFLKNGDLVTACSDGVVRIWTTHQDRIAEPNERESFISQLSDYKINRSKLFKRTAERLLNDQKLWDNVTRQVEFYLGDKNLLNDRNDYLKTTISENGTVELKSICSFPKMRKLLGQNKTGNIEEEILTAVADCLRSSDFLKISNDGKKVGRKKPLATLEEIDRRTVAVSPLPYDVSCGNLETFFRQFGKVNSVTLPNTVSNKKVFCGTALVEFSTEEVVQKFLELTVEYAGVRLVFKSKKHFDIEREKEAEELFEKTERKRKTEEFSNEKQKQYSERVFRGS
ncbi:hypothetical protein RND81_09G177200 [Saponaria officinalis]|uniref:Uncharacterized protein n=1 Tax=Saponaria officinalis TaxID=3572 RepID=A0AAW1IM48_SAPOF